jgi:hypothetical protein
MRLPRTAFEWAEMFHDDLGFAPREAPSPTRAAPGSPAKVAVLAERARRGQALWAEADAKDLLFQEIESPDTHEVCGSEAYGAAVGMDRAGRKHRYALWWTNEQASGGKMLYVPATAGFADVVSRDAELAAIAQHASCRGARQVAVVPLFSARVTSQRELETLSYPITEYGLLWMRWLARHADVIVCCWGEIRLLNRYQDCAWMLHRTAQKRIYSLSSSLFWPPPVRDRTAAIHRYNYRAAAELCGESLDLDEEEDE